MGELAAWLVLADNWWGFHHAMVAMLMLPQFACITRFQIALAAFPNMLDAVVKLVQAFVTEEHVVSFFFQIIQYASMLICHHFTPHSFTKLSREGFILTTSRMNFQSPP